LKKREKFTVKVGRPKERAPHLPDKVVRPKKGGGYKRAVEKRRVRKETQDA
jgi:hypothetical protein